ncbi:hypothetical protein K491DRAFT_697080 [Lophiostoma macrostomum CBS 122681]|uniref:Uncharacterized protein n=1 Tax=Lophiostoma macrostomum CBS 122681 TaxID=1314788 RepID=A0A6A6ST11_9PLEO|nr:hypothetical protein K491DRAFT_697080 [Lophiostoma macrostomum CBS 122681]
MLPLQHETGKICSVTFTAAETHETTEASNAIEPPKTLVSMSIFYKKKDRRYSSGAAMIFPTSIVQGLDKQRIIDVRYTVTFLTEAISQPAKVIPYSANRQTAIQETIEELQRFGEHLREVSWNLQGWVLENGMLENVRQMSRMGMSAVTLNASRTREQPAGTTVVVCGLSVHRGEYLVQNKGGRWFERIGDIAITLDPLSQ